LREPAAAAAARCEIAILIGPDCHNALTHLPGALPVLRATLVPLGAEAIAHRRVFAFAGIARPEKFFTSLRTAGADIVAHVAFPDHHRYTPRQLDRLLARAAQANALPVTTPKDAVRLPPAIRAQMTIVGVALAWESPHAIDLWLTHA
jgi:tetraacyldisaccharide 4'-kinase